MIRHALICLLVLCAVPAWAVDTTPPTAPPLVRGRGGEPTQNATTGAQAARMLITWGPSIDDTGVVRYELDLSTSPTFSSFVPCTGCGTGDGLWHQFNVGANTEMMVGVPADGILAPATEYNFRVRAVDAAGNVSAWTAGKASTGLLPLGDQVKMGPAHFAGDIYDRTGYCSLTSPNRLARCLGRCTGDGKVCEHSDQCASFNCALSSADCGAGGACQPDRDDLDDSFGQHGGAVTVTSGQNEAEWWETSGFGDITQFNLAVPNAGSYDLILQSENFNGADRPLQVSWSQSSVNCASGHTNLTPTMDTRVKDTPYRWSIPGLTTGTVHVCITPTTNTGPRRIAWGYLQPTLAVDCETAGCLFNGDPTVGTHPRVAISAADLATWRTRLTTPGPQQTLYSDFLTDTTVSGNECVPGRCAGGSNNALDCLDDASCPGGFCGPQDNHDASRAGTEQWIAYLGTSGADPGLFPSGYPTGGCGCASLGGAGCSGSSYTATAQGRYRRARDHLWSMVNQWPTWRAGNFLDQSTHVVTAALLYDALRPNMVAADARAFGYRIGKELFGAVFASNTAVTRDVWTGLITSDSNPNLVDDTQTNQRGAAIGALVTAAAALDNYTLTPAILTYGTTQARLALSSFFDGEGSPTEPGNYAGLLTENLAWAIEALRRKSCNDLGFGYVATCPGGTDLYQYADRPLAGFATWLRLAQAGIGEQRGTPYGDSLADWTIGGANMIAFLMNGYATDPAGALMRAMFDDWFPNVTGGNLDLVKADWHEFNAGQIVLYYRPDVSPANTAAVLPRLKVYNATPRSFGSYFMHGNLSDPNELVVQVQGALAGGDHSHPNQGSPAVSARGHALVDDRGKFGDYGTPGNNFHKSSGGHGALLIDGKGQYKEQSFDRYLATVTNAADGARFAVVTTDVTAAYNFNNQITPNLTSATATQVMLRENDGVHGLILDVQDIKPGASDSASHLYRFRHGMRQSEGGVFSAITGGTRVTVSGGVRLDRFFALPSSGITTTLCNNSPACGAGCTNCGVGAICEGNCYDWNLADFAATAVAPAPFRVVSLLTASLTTETPTVPTVNTTANSAGFTVGNERLYYSTTQALACEQKMLSDAQVRGSVDDGANGAESFVVTNATTLSYGTTCNQVYFVADAPVKALALQYAPTQISGQLDLGAARTLQLHAASTPTQITVAGVAVPFTYDNAAQLFTIAKPNLLPPRRPAALVVSLTSVPTTTSSTTSSSTTSSTGSTSTTSSTLPAPPPQHAARRRSRGNRRVK